MRMQKFTRFVLSHSPLIAVFWIIATIAGIALVGAASEAMDQKFSVPEREGWETNETILKTFGSGGDTVPLIAVTTLPDATSVNDSDVQHDLVRVEAAFSTAVPGARIAGPASTHSDAFLSDDGRTVFAIAYAPPDPDEPFGGNLDAEEDARAAIEKLTVAGQPIHLTGYDALYNEQGGSDGPGVLIEAVLGGFGALIVLGFVFGSLLALVPLLTAIPAILTSFLIVYAMTTVTDVSPIVQFLITLIGLGVAIDYSLIVVVRWREERAGGLEGDAAIIAAMQTAGRAVVFSGTTVAVGLLALIALPLPFLRSVGYGGMVIPLVSVAVALTLLPVVLHWFGDVLDWPHRRTDEKASRWWSNWAGGIVKRPSLAFAAAFVILAVLLVAALKMNLGISDVDTLPAEGDARAGIDALQDAGIGPGVLLPYEITVADSAPNSVVLALSGVDGIRGVVAPPGPSWTRDGLTVVEAFGIADGSSAEGRDLIDQVRASAHSVGSDVKVGGGLASNDDFIDAVYGNFPLMLALIASVTFVLLARAFRSLLLPAKAVILNVISVGAAWGVMTIVWQQGHGSQIWGIEPTGAITAWIPVMVFAFLYGLSMDYEVFILARMREEYDSSGSTATAVVRGIGRTGRLVTSAALILFLAFVSMASGPDTDLKVLATGLAAGILIDATVIRGLLVPATIALFGRWNWYLPGWAARILRVEPSQAVPEATIAG